VPAGAFDHNGISANALGGPLRERGHGLAQTRHRRASGECAAVTVRDIA
jgi:hypothetical protein